MELDVAPERGLRGEREPQRIRAVGLDAVRVLFSRGLLDGGRHVRLHQPAGAFLHQRLEVDAVDDVDGVQNVALGFRHFLAVGIAHQAMHVDLAKRHVVHEFQTHHDHACDPEKDDVEAGDQHGGRVKGLERIALSGPPQRREGPQGRRKPGVKHVLVLHQYQVRVQAVLLAHLGFVVPDVDRALAVVPGRDAVPPPQLAADAPVLQVVHPLEVGLAPVLGDELDAPVFHGPDGRLGQRLHADVPLAGQVRLDDGTGAVPARDDMAVLARLCEQALRREVLDDPLARLETVQVPVGGRRIGVDAGVVGKDVDLLQVVAQAHLVVVEIMGRGDLHAPGTELRVHVFVGNDRDFAIGQGQADRLADDVPVALVLGVHGNRAVAEQRLGPGGGHRHVAIAVRIGVADVPHVPVFLFRDDFQVGYGGVQHGIPVDQALAAVDEPLVVEANEHGPDGFGETLVHGEPLARPVQRRAHAFQLAADRLPGMLLPLPDFLDELFAPETVARLAQGIQLALHDHLRGDPGMVRAGLPERVEARHAVIPGQAVHQGVVEGVPHVQGAGDVGRGDHDAIRGTAVPARCKIVAVLPVPVPRLLDACRLVGFFHGRFSHAGFRTRAMGAYDAADTRRHASAGQRSSRRPGAPQCPCG